MQKWGLVRTTLCISTLEYTERKTNIFSFSQSNSLPSVNINNALPDEGKKKSEKQAKLPPFRAKIYEEQIAIFFEKLISRKKHYSFFS